MNWPIFWLALLGAIGLCAALVGYVVAGVAIERALIRRFGDMGYFFPVVWLFGGAALAVATILGLVTP